MANIHPTAVIGENAKIDPTAQIGAYAIIEGGAQIGANTVVEPHARICGGARIGANCAICSFSTIAGLPQDLHFDKNLETFVEIGDGTTVREGSTVHRATFEGKSTIVGKGCLLMSNTHVGHDCVLGDRVIVANFTALGGHVVVGDDAFISGGVMLHQKIRVGCGVMVSGNAACSMDIPPYVNAFERNNIAGLNLVGLMRRKVSREAIAELKHLYSFIYASGNPRKNAKEAFENGMAKTKEGEIFARFFFEGEAIKPILRPHARGE
ncbi:MAG: acyl-ACP--UDP-N-acetylglucosamine O-acyltransferase [Opitutales bacterium]|nr:acyl-ACP--UDP-N-acetylglucosamine O-acyltransferase [Opitutales bacterium]